MSDWGEEGAFRNPFHSGGGSANDRLRRPQAHRGGAGAAPASRGNGPGGVKQRLGEREAPPRDPANKFLADSSRDEGPSRAWEGPGTKRGRGRGGGMGGREMHPPRRPGRNNEKCDKIHGYCLSW